MKLGLLIEYNMRNLFLVKSYTTCGRETIPRRFSKNSKLSITLDQYSKVVYILFFFACQRWGLSKVIETKLQTTCFYLIHSVFKRGLELVSLSHFLHIFWGKIFRLLYSITWPYSNAWLLLFRDILGNMYIAIVC